MSLRRLLEKSSDADLLREMVGFAAQRLMALEVESLIGAGHGERRPDRINPAMDTETGSGRPAPIDDQIAAFLNRPLEGEGPYLWLDATYVKVRANGRIVSVAVIVAVAVNSDGRREVLDLASSMTLVSDAAYHSFIGEVEA